LVYLKEFLGVCTEVVHNNQSGLIKRSVIIPL